MSGKAVDFVVAVVVGLWLLWPLALEVWDLWREGRYWRGLDRERDLETAGEAGRA